MLSVFFHKRSERKRENLSNPNHHHHRSPTSILNNPTPKKIKVGARASIACETCWYVTLALILISFKIKIYQLTYRKW
ncbi:hypothetical protein CROQUDRAFT_650693 [Cronartium quercuum f. sp. fusiforme G11]|uniref:Uncharacterized protein n=1 Tax=Cronartium quercuum f. sp. fusiforme G11 TaxID=708437 RepID=A0A9P6NY65_9BASI|nr:hypothetical protein CROQUDRAFT_650693 [Cronartium quercuum f. sp. fusiforme G11]